MSYYENPSDFYGKNFGSGSPNPDFPQLRSDLIIRRQVYGPDEITYVIKDPITRDYFKFPPITWDIFALMDGQHSKEQIIEEYNQKYPLEPIGDEFLNVCLEDLKGWDLLDISATEKNLILAERIRTQRQLLVERQNKNKWTFEYITVFKFDPNELLDRLIPHIRWIWTKWFLIASLTAIGLMFFINIIRWHEFWQGTVDLYAFNRKSLWDVIVFFLLFIVSLSIHEFGHALTLKNYGGECHEAGFMLFYGSPAFYVESGDGYLITNRTHRLWFYFSGVYGEFLLCTIGAYIWFLTLPGTSIHDLAFLVFVFSGLSGFLMNMNPLVRLDGYWILSEFLGIQNLREESFNFVKRWVKRHIFKLQADEPPEQSKRKRRIFRVYGIISLCYTLALYTLIVSWIKNIYFATLDSGAYVALPLTVLYMFRKKLLEGYGFLRVVYLDKKEVLMKRSKKVLYAFGVLLLLSLIPITQMKISSSFHVEPLDRAEIRAQMDGFVDQVLVNERQSVTKGQILARLRNPELTEDQRRIESRLQRIDQEISAAASAGDNYQHQQKSRAKDQILKEQAENEVRLQKIILKSPIAGLIGTPLLREKVGTYIRTGDVFCTVFDLRKAKTKVPVSEYDIEDVKIGQRVLMKLDAFPGKTFEGRVEKISPAVREKVATVEGAFATFDVDVVIDNSSRKLVPGMRGYVKILAGRHSIMGRVIRELYRGTRALIW
jgi:putative peptide zinc metalloprotease protein